MSPASPTTANPVRPLPALLAAVVCAGLLTASVVSPSSTRLETWPWAAFVALGWLLPIGVALTRFVRERPCSRFGGLLDDGLGLLALSATASALASPICGTVLPHLLPVLGTCALPFALLPALHTDHATRTWRISAVLLVCVLAASLILWLSPWHGLRLPESRNDQPFGHGNITGSVAVLAATWLAAGAVREQGRNRRLFIFGVVLAAATVVSSESRGAVLSLAAAGATAAAIVLLRRKHRLLFLLLVVVLAIGAVASNARMRGLVLHGRWSVDARESNDQRSAMLVGGLRLGAERPLLGWGPGAVPHVFPRVRGDLPGTADNVLQLHNSAVQLWATLGAAGMLAGLFIATDLALRLRSVVWTPERTALAAGLAGAATVMLFDHPFATPVFAVLAAAHLAAFATAHAPDPAPDTDSDAESDADPTQEKLARKRRRQILACGIAALIPALYATTRDLAARRAYDQALDRAERGDASGYASGLRRAIALAPGDPYYPHLLASWLATGHPLSDTQARPPDEAAALLRQTLALNPDLEYAHYNLGWLLVTTHPDEAAEHFIRAARLAPQRGEVYFGLGCARLNLGDVNGAGRAFAAEWLLNPAFAWSPLWRQSPFDALKPRVHALAAAAVRARGDDPWRDLQTPAATGAAYRRLRTGYGVLMGHPEGPPPVDFNIQQPIVLPAGVSTHVPEFGWLPGKTLLDFLETRTP